MAVAETDALTQMVRANDKLLKALVTLLAIKDEHLLDEMRTVFAAAVQSRNEIGRADQPTWDHIRHELRVIGNLVDTVDGHQAAAPDPVRELN